MFEVLDLGELAVVVLSALLRVVGADVVDCRPEVADWPAEVSEQQAADRSQIRACGVVAPGGGLWLTPRARQQLRFGGALLGLTTWSSAPHLGLPGGVAPGAYWLHRDGRILETPLYDNGPDYFQHGLVRYIDARGKLGFVDRQLRVVIPAAFDVALPFHAGRAEVCNGCVRPPRSGIDAEQREVASGGTWGSVDRRGRVRWRAGP